MAVTANVVQNISGIIQRNSVKLQQATKLYVLET